MAMLALPVVTLGTMYHSSLYGRYRTEGVVYGHSSLASLSTVSLSMILEAIDDRLCDGFLHHGKNQGR